jgi:phytoene desaturase
MVAHVVVVGAGPGGLATAMLAAGMGLNVTLIEAKSTPGGRMGRIVEEGFSFDTGPTILQLPHVLAQVFERSGLRLSDYVRLVRLDPNTRIHFWDGTQLDTFMDAQRNRDAWARLSPGGATRFDRFFEEHVDKYRVAYDRFIAADAKSAARYFNPLRLMPAARFAPWESLHRSLSRSLGDERLVYAMSYPSKYLGLHPTTCSSVFSVVPFLELAFGVWYPMGGFRALADGMLRAFRDLGGRVRMGSPVRKVRVERGRATGVVLEGGERVDADHVIVNADWALAKRTLIDPEHRPSHPDRRIERRSYSCSSFMLYLGLDRVYDEVPHHAIHLSASVRRTDRDALEDRTLDEHDPPFYVCNPTPTDPATAPRGGSALYVLVPTPNTGHAVDWQAKREPYARLVMRRLARVGIPDVERHVKLLRIATAETWRDEFRVFRGAVFNLSHGWTQLGPLRPQTADEDVRQLHWVGGGTHPGSGLLTIFESANIAAADLAARFGRSLAPSKAPELGAPVETPRPARPAGLREAHAAE